MSFHQILYKISPKQLFLIDSIGALVSAVMLGLVLTRFEPVFGMPAKVLYPLSLIACTFCIHSFLCFLGLIGNLNLHMKITAIANLLYCCLTLGLVVYLYQKLTVLGLIYFVLEIIVVAILSVIELESVSNQQIQD